MLVQVRVVEVYQDSSAGGAVVVRVLVPLPSTIDEVRRLVCRG